MARPNFTRNSPEPGIVAKLVRHDACTDTDSRCCFVQVSTQFPRQHFSPARAGQQESIGREGIECAEKPQALHDFTDKRVHGDHAFGPGFAQRDLDGPVIRPSGAETIARKIHAFADAHAGMAKQQHHVTGEIVTA